MGFAKSIGAGFQALVQGEVTQNTQLLEDSRRLLGANVVLRAQSLSEAASALGDLPAALAPSARPSRRRRYAESAAPRSGWVPTAERFRDPASGVVMRVWVDPADCSRHYVPDGASA